MICCGERDRIMIGCGEGDRLGGEGRPMMGLGERKKNRSMIQFSNSWSIHQI